MISRPSQDIMAHLWSILNQNHYYQSHSRSTSRSHLTSWSHLPKRAKLQFIFPGRSWSFKVSIFAIRHLPFTWRGALGLLILAGWGDCEYEKWEIHMHTYGPQRLLPPKKLSPRDPFSIPLANLYASYLLICLYWIHGCLLMISPWPSSGDILNWCIYFTAQELSWIMRMTVYISHIQELYVSILYLTYLSLHLYV